MEWGFLMVMVRCSLFLRFVLFMLWFSGLLGGSVAWGALSDGSVCPGCVSLDLKEVGVEKFMKVGCQILHWNCLVPNIPEEAAVSESAGAVKSPGGVSHPNPFQKGAQNQPVVPAPAPASGVSGVTTPAPTNLKGGGTGQSPAGSQPVPPVGKDSGAQMSRKGGVTNKGRGGEGVNYATFSVKTYSAIPSGDFEQFFIAVLDEMGFEVVEKKGVYTIRHMGGHVPGLSPGYILEMVNLRYLNPDDVVSVVGGLYPSASLSYITGQSSVMIFDSKRVVGSIMDLIVQLDVASRIDTYVYHCRYSLPSKIVSGLSGVGVTMTAVDDSGVIVVRGTGDQYLQLVPQLQSLDVLPNQILVDVAVYEISRGKAKHFSFDMVYKGVQDLLFTSASAVGLPQFSGGMGGVLSFAMGGSSRLSLLLDTLVNDSVAKVIARPSLLLQSGNKARVELASQIPLATGYTTTQPVGGTTVTNGSGQGGGGSTSSPTTTTVGQITYQSVGTILDLSATVLGEFVTLTVTQEVSNPGASFAVAGQGYQSVDSRKANTVATVKAGETLFMAGLSREAITKEESGSILSELPILGPLFKRESYKKDVEDLVILITPYIISDVNRGALSMRVSDRIRVIEQVQ